MRPLPSIALTLWCFSAFAATVSGRITNPGGGGVAGGEVRLWARTAKGFSFTATAGQVIPAAADGTFTFSGVPAGDYKVDVRPGGGLHADRWYDADGNGYTPGGADVITLTAMQARTGVDITVEPSGGVDGNARINGALAAGLQVRTELVTDYRVHHNEDSKPAPHQGNFYMRQLPPGQYRTLVHDPTGANGDAVSAAPFTIAAGMNHALGTLNLVAAPADPTEPNNTSATATTFTATRMTPYVSPAGARIGPRNTGDVDWYCTTAAAGERFIARVEGVVTVEGGMTHESPWVDPVVAFYRGGMKVSEDDDSAPDSLGAELDTGELTAGPVCFAVSTFGDTAYNGMSQGSAGTYRLTVTYGNRGPVVTPTVGGMPLPSMLMIDEGDSVTVDVAWTDPENDNLSATWSLAGASMAIHSAGSFNTTQPSGTFSWTAPQTAARDSPYVLTIRVGDGEIFRTITVTIVVGAVNVAPSVPVLVSPTDGGRVPSLTPTLVCAESYDVDEETLSYDFELWYGDAGAPVQTGNVVGVDGGWKPDAGAPPTVDFTAAAIPENTVVRWRARAFDGTAANGHSPWSAYEWFVVDVMNDPPLAPVLDKPADGETVLVIRPTLAAVPPLDPEGDAYSLFFEVSRDSMFTMSTVTSSPVPVGPGATTMWTVDRDLEWGTQYFARAWAVDVRNGKSAYSNVNMFSVRANMPPTVPPFLEPGTTVCNGGYLPSKPLSVQIGNATDTEGDQIRIQLRVFLASEDPMTATPAFERTQLQTNGFTEFDTSAAVVPEKVQHRFVARAVDNYGASAWSECLFTVGEPPVVDAGAGGGGGSQMDGGTGGGVSTKQGCKCDSGAAGFGVLALVALIRRRRRSP